MSKRLRDVLIFAIFGLVVVLIVSIADGRNDSAVPVPYPTTVPVQLTTGLTPVKQTRTVVVRKGPAQASSVTPEDESSEVLETYED